MTKNIEVLKIERGKKIEVVGRFETLPVAKFHIENTFAERYPQGKFQTRKVEMPKSLLTDTTYANETVSYLVVEATLNELDLKNMALDIRKDTLLGLYIDNVIENKRALNKIEKVQVEQNDEDGNVAEVRYITAETEPLPLPKIQSTLENMLFDTLLDGEVDDSDEEDVPEDVEEADEATVTVTKTTTDKTVKNDESENISISGNMGTGISTDTLDDLVVSEKKSDADVTNEDETSLANAGTIEEIKEVHVTGTETGRLDSSKENTSAVPNHADFGNTESFAEEVATEVESEKETVDEIVENQEEEIIVEETEETNEEITTENVAEETPAETENAVDTSTESTKEEESVEEAVDVETHEEEEIIIYDNGDGTFSDSEGNQVDEDGNILKTKEELEAEETVDDGDISDALDALNDLDDIPDLD